MAYGDTKAGQMRLATVIDPQLEEFRKAWNAVKGEMLRLSGSLSILGGEAVNLMVKAVVKSDIEHTAMEAFAKTDMRGEGWAWNFFIDDGFVPLARAFADEGRKFIITSVAHWKVSDAGEYGKFLTAHITGFALHPLDS